MLNRIWTLILKELLAMVRDKKSRTVLFIPPITQLLIFALAATLDVQNVPIGILNLDKGKESYELAQRFHGAPTFSRIIYLQSMDEIPDFVDTQKGAMVVSIDEQFSKRLLSKQPVNVQLILDGRKSNTAQIIAGYASTIINQYNRDFAKEVQIRLQPTQIIPRNWFNPNLIYYWYNIPSLCGILTMLVGLTVTALSVARERELGTFDQLLVSPVQPIEILIGKTVPAIIIGMSEGTIIVLAALFIFKVPLTGSLILLYACMCVFISSIIGVGLFISSLCSTQQQAILGTFVFMTPSVLLSGFATPIENMPNWLQPFTFLIPLRYFLIISKGIFLKAMPWYIVLHNVWPMVIIAVVTFVGALWFFRHRLE